jgi:hypothetical protein
MFLKGTVIEDGPVPCTVAWITLATYTSETGPVQFIAFRGKFLDKKCFPEGQNGEAQGRPHKIHLYITISDNGPFQRD